MTPVFWVKYSSRFCIPPDGDRLASIAPFFHQEDLLGLGMRSDPQVGRQGLMAVRANLDHPVFATLAVPDQDPAADQVQRIQGKIRLA